MKTLYSDKNLYDNFTGVIELTSDDFTIKNNSIKINNKLLLDKPGFVNFYAPWCKHCIKMVPIWSDLAIEFRNKFIICAVNCENKKNYKIRNALKILQYPTIKSISKKGTICNYNDSYSKEDLLYNICTKI